MNFALRIRLRAADGPEMKVLDHQWSACMKGKGFPGIPNPPKARGDAANFYSKYSKDEAFGKEVALAVADAECDSQMNYTSQRKTLEDRYFTAGLRKYESELAAAREMNSKALAKAKSILAGGEG